MLTPENDAVSPAEKETVVSVDSFAPTFLLAGLEGALKKGWGR